MSRLSDRSGFTVNPLVPSRIFDQLDEDEEICLVKVPNDLDMDKLYNIDIQEDFSVGDKEYTTSISTDITGLLVGTPEAGGRVHPVHLKVERVYTVRPMFYSLPLAVFGSTPSAPYIVPQITDLFRPKRHPIYGVDISKIKKRPKKKTDETLTKKIKVEENIKVENIKVEMTVEEYQEHHEFESRLKTEVKVEDTAKEVMEENQHIAEENNEVARTTRTRKGSRSK